MITNKKKTQSNQNDKSIIKVAGIWELGWNTPIKEVELWEYPLRDLGVNEFYMTPITGIQASSVQERNSMEEILEENKNLTIVFLDERGKTSLKDFKHPKNALYVFGKASLSAMSAYGNKESISVKIDTIENKGLLWPHQAVAITLYDRFMKSLSNKSWQ
jgi:tRNA(Leu) C34 or U34 (ribose-2'-O)-methylase TrmL